MESRIYNMWEHKGWGNRISWSDFGKRRINGHLSRRPKVGDEIRAQMKSGKTGRFAVIKVEYCRDPDDMFFATLADNGYVEDAAEQIIRDAREQ